MVISYKVIIRPINNRIFSTFKLKLLYLESNYCAFIAHAITDARIFLETKFFQKRKLFQGRLKRA